MPEGEKILMLMNICKGVIFAGACTGLCSIGLRAGKQVRKTDKARRLALIGLLFWSLLVLFMTLFTFTMDPQLTTNVGFMPLHTLREIYRYGQSDLAFQLVFNVLMFMPFGFLLPVAFPALRQASLCTTVCLMGSLIIEMCQLFSGRSFDIDDILCNTLGGLLGFGMLLVTQALADRHAHKKASPQVRWGTWLTLAAFVLLLIFPFAV